MGRGELDVERNFLNKWEMYKALCEEELGGCRLPETLPFAAESLQQLLTKHGGVYIKPVGTWGGNGISRVEQQRDAFHWTLQGEAPAPYADLQQLTDAILPVYEQSLAIVQQAAPLVRAGDAAFDVRVHMQREPEGQWVFAGALVRVSGPDSIVSNVGISGGRVRTVDHVLSEVRGGAYDPALFQAQLESIGVAICRVLDEYRIFSEIGIDLGVAGDGGLWLIEVNTDDALGGPSHDLFAELPDPTMYRQIRQRWETRQLGMFRLFLDWLKEDE